MGILVICSYKPKPGRAADVMAQVGRHVPVLKAEGLVTDRPPLVMTAADGTVVEIFEWLSEEASRSAHANPKVSEIWGALADAADFVPLSALEEAAGPFAHFTPVA